MLRALAGAATRRAEAETVVGNCYFRMHRNQPAISHFEAAIKLDPKPKDSWIYLSRCYAGMGQQQRAIDTLKTWLTRNGNDPDVLFWIGSYYDDLAANTFEQMAEKHSDSYMVYLSQGEHYIERKDYAAARKALDRALALAPNAPGIHYTLGSLYWLSRDLEKAKQELETELRTNAHHAQANYLMGDIYVTQRDPQKAIPYLERALAANPKIWDAHRALGRALVLENKFEEGVREFQIVADANPTDDTIHGLLSNTYRRMGNLARAKEEGELFERLNAARRDRVPKPTVGDVPAPSSQP